MIRMTGRYHEQSVELDSPLELQNGTEVELVVRVRHPDPEIERAEFEDAASLRLEEEWDNPEDAIYDDWKKHCR